MSSTAKNKRKRKRKASARGFEGRRRLMGVWQDFQLWVLAEVPEERRGLYPEVDGNAPRESPSRPLPIPRRPLGDPQDSPCRPLVPYTPTPTPTPTLPPVEPPIELPINFTPLPRNQPFRNYPRDCLPSIPCTPSPPPSLPPSLGTSGNPIYLSSDEELSGAEDDSFNAVSVTDNINTAEPPRCPVCLVSFPLP
ncbi:hypothetical protein FRC11_013639, partial [Ceratobasidium sp. 423]